MRGSCGTAATYPINGLAYEALRSAYDAQYDDTLESNLAAPNIWDSFFLVAAAATQQANQFPGEPLGGPHLRDALTAVSRDGQVLSADQWRDLVSSLRRGYEVDYDGASGPVDFDSSGQTIGAYEIWCVAPDGQNFDQLRYFDANMMTVLRGMAGG